MKKIIVLIAAISMVFVSAFNVYAVDFSDVKQTNWAYDAVNAMSEKAVISGYPDGSFKPSNTVTYGEFIKMALIAATGEDVGNAETGSASEGGATGTAVSTTGGGWASNYYNKSVELGYFTKADIAKSDMNDKITRAHMALIISSILGDVTIEDYDGIQEGITDITVKTAYEYDITKAYASGILTGYTDKTFRPEKTLTRAEAAIVIYRLVDASKRVYPDTVLETGGSTPVKEKTIDEMITNLTSFVTGNGAIDDDLAEAETYEIDEAYAKYGMELHEKNGLTWFTVPEAVADELGDIYFVKDSKVIELGKNSMDGEAYIYYCDITTVDYIASLTWSTKHLLLITNPFKQ